MKTEELNAQAREHKQRYDAQRRREKATVMPKEPGDEDTTQIDHELIANDLDTVAKLVGRLGYPDMATEIGALVAKYRKPAASDSE